MGPGRPNARGSSAGPPSASPAIIRPVGWKSDDADAVTPVIGAVLILAITVMGIGGVLFWGAPIIDRIQSQNSQTAIVGEFEEIRDSSRDLSVPDHSRFPTVVIPKGELALERGTRIMVTADRDAGSNPNCDFHVINWADSATATKGTVNVYTSSCRGSAKLQIYGVNGATLVSVYPETSVTSGNAVTPSPAVDFSTGDWLFRLQDASCTGGVCADAWLLSSDRVTWNLAATSGNRAVAFDNGAIFSTTGATIFLEKEAAIGDSVFGSSYYGFWLRSLSAARYSSISGAGSHQVYLSLLGNYDRIDSTVGRIRFDMAGSLAQSWCNALVSRNVQLTGSPARSYHSDTTNCAAITGTDGERSVCYGYVASTGNSCTTQGSQTFTFRFLHARIYTSLSV